MELPGRVICVLGMHRSGTSCVTGSLEEAGLFLAERHTWNPFNTKGNRENQNFVDLDDAVLAANNGAWNRPPGKVVWSASQLLQARELLGNHSGHSPFGFKDPRVLLVLDGWKKVFPALEFVGVFRHPNAVANSLGNRDAMPRAKALELWYEYNSLLYKEHKRSRFPLLCFDEDQGVFQQKLEGVVTQLGLKNPDQASAFYDAELRTANADTQQALPWKVQRLYRKLIKRAV
ncbi:MAG: hypothetical protein V2I26_10900 [Halieaceae bacterium]|jgi:hypothetical protein|nr:hypothetical protein [Halieaceae bacterium]